MTECPGFVRVALCALVDRLRTRDLGTCRDHDARRRDAEGRYYSPRQMPQGTAVLLFINATGTAHRAPLAALAETGFHVLAVDQRGFGESGGVQIGPSDSPTLAADADAAFEYLAARPGVDRMRLAAGGASCGVTEAVDLAARHHELKAVMVLSGNASPRGLSYVATAPTLPIFGAVSEGDAFAADTRDRDGIKHPHSVMNLCRERAQRDPGIPHGVDLFEKHPELMPELVNWFRETDRRSVRPRATDRGLSCMPQIAR
jgi:pimeloyl-ACP methyl ester carboxylesterase